VGTKLYVGNLNYNVTNDQLGQLFAQVGTVVESVVIIDKRSGRSKGFGFVTMSSEEEAKKAVALHETDFEGRKIIVNEARPQTPRENRPYNKNRYKN